jgi:hypothetical protein
VVGQHQDQARIEQFGLLVAQVAVGGDQHFVEIVAGRVGAEIALAGFGEIGIQVEAHGGSFFGFEKAPVVPENPHAPRFSTFHRGFTFHFSPLHVARATAP